MILFLKILLLATTLFTSDTKWQRINTDQQISFQFPNYPQKIERLVHGIPSTIFQTKDITCVAGVVCSDVSAKNITLTSENAPLFYEELKKGTLSIETATLKDERTIPYENMLIKEIEYTIIKGKYEMTYFKRFIFRNNYIYQLSIGGRTRHRDIIMQTREMFFSSVIFNEQSSAGNP